MTTLLARPLTREILLGEDAFKVVVSPTGIRLTAKGRRKGVEVTWESILALGDGIDTVPSEYSQSRTSDLPQPVAADVAREVRVASDALGRARSVLAGAGTLPAAVLAQVEPDPVYGRQEHRSDWYIEPLLTIAELASIVRLSRSAVARLPLRSIVIGGERRYRQSEVRQYLLNQERIG
jgi:hypothetical protein